jgi:hypothetical protein
MAVFRGSNGLHVTVCVLSQADHGFVFCLLYSQAAPARLRSFCQLLFGYKRIPLKPDALPHLGPYLLPRKLQSNRNQDALGVHQPSGSFELLGGLRFRQYRLEGQVLSEPQGASPRDR